ATIFAAGGAVGLLKRLEDQLLFVLRNADTGIADRNFDRLIELAEHRVAWAPALGGSPHGHGDATLRREFERVRKQVEDNLLEPLLVGADRQWQGFVEIDLESQALFRRQLAEGTLHVLLEAGHRHVADLDRDGAGLDLGQVENVVDEIEQVGARAMYGARKLDLLVAEVALLVVGQQFR